MSTTRGPDVGGPVPKAARVAARVAPLRDDLLVVDRQAEVSVWLQAGMTVEEIEAAWHEPLPTK